MDPTNRKKDDLRHAVKKRYQHLINEEATGNTNNGTHVAKYGVTQRQDLLRLAKEYLACIEHTEKFIIVPYNHMVLAAFANFGENKVDFKKIAVAFEKLEQFAANLIHYPWRQEFKKIKTFTAAYRCQVSAVLPQSEDVLEMLGYRKLQNVFVLQRIAPEEKLLIVALDLFLCQAESLVMEDVYNEMSSKGFLPNQVVHARELMVGDRIECANFMRKQMKPEGTPQLPKVKEDSFKVKHDFSGSSGRHKDRVGATVKSDRSSSHNVAEVKIVQSRTRGSTKSAYTGTSGYSSLGSRAQGAAALSYVEKRDIEKPGSWDESWTTKQDLGVDEAEELFPHGDERQIIHSTDIRYPPDDIHGLPTTHDEHIMASMAEVFGREDEEPQVQTSKAMHLPDTFGHEPYKPELYKTDLNRYLLDVASMSKGHTADSVPQPPPVHYPPHGLAVSPTHFPRPLGGDLLRDLQTDDVKGYEVTPMSNQLNRFPAEPTALADAETARLPRESSWLPKDGSSSRRYKGREAPVHYVPGHADVTDGQGDQNIGDSLLQATGGRRNSLYDNVDSLDGAIGCPGSNGKTSPQTANHAKSSSPDLIQTGGKQARNSHWTCWYCSASNDVTTHLCIRCGTNNADNQNTSVYGQTQKPDHGRNWSCQFCTTINSTRSVVCMECGKSRFPGAEASPVNIGGRPCQVCTFVNSQYATKCSVCNERLSAASGTCI